MRSFFRSFHRSKLSRQIFIGGAVALLLPISFSSHALTSKTSSVIHGNAPYLTFDGGLTRTINTDGLLGISLSNGVRYTPSTNNSSTTPIELPVTGQSFADISMLVPVDTDSIALSTLVSSPYNYWGDDDGDGDITATGNLSLSIVDKNNKVVSRNTVPEICNAPYRLNLANTYVALITRYGFPNTRSFDASSVIYYINPKASPKVCFAKPILMYGTGYYAGPTSIWDPDNGFLPQSTIPSSYSLNFPTTGAHGLYFDLDIGGINQSLSWEPVSHGGITATMSDSTSKRVRVTLSGPVATSSQHMSSNPGNIPRPSLPQTFELVGRDSRGNAVVKYGFTLKQWFVNRGGIEDSYSNTLSWCNNIGYRMPLVMDLTNASCQGSGSHPYCQGSVGATPSSLNNLYQRGIGAGFFTEWGRMLSYSGIGFDRYGYWTSDSNGSYQFAVFAAYGDVGWAIDDNSVICAYP